MSLSKFALALVLIFVSPILHAKDQLDEVSQVVPVAKLEPIINTGSIVQILASLVFVIGIIYLLAWYLRRQQSSVGLSQKMTVIAALSVGARERVVLVQLAEKQLLLGVSPGRVNLLQAYDQPIVNSRHEDQQSSFAKLLSRHSKPSNNDEIDSSNS